MKNVLFMLIVLVSGNAFSSQPLAGMTLHSATIAADRLASEWLKKHDDVDLKLTGRVNQRLNLYFNGKRYLLKDLLSYRVCYRKLNNGPLEYCYELSRNRHLNRHLIRHIY